MIDSCIGPYRIVRQIGEDRFGRLFQAIDPERKKQVAIKSLRPEAADRPAVATRLYSEAETLALLNHPHIARIFGFMRLNDQLYLVMEFVEGESLATILEEKHRLELNVALGFFHQILPAVQYAHELGIVHGDLKPANIMVSSFAQIKILGFAISAILGNSSLNGGPNDSKTAYMSPEQMRGEPIDARSDIYSLGILLYRLIVGKLPFQSEPQPGISVSEGGVLPPSPSSVLGAHCPAWLDGFMLRALALDPSERFQSVSAMSSVIRISSEAKAPNAPPKHARGRVKDGTRSMLYARARARSLRAPQPLAQSPHRKPGAWRKRLHRFSDPGWKPFVVLAILLASVMIEPSIFDGANTRPRPDFEPLAASRTGIVEIPLKPAPAPLVAGADDNIEISQPSNGGSKPQSQRRVVKRESRSPRPIQEPIEKPANKTEDLHLEALDTKRTVTYRAEPVKDRPVLKELKAIEPSPPRPREENKPVKPQLNIKWEN